MAASTIDTDRRRDDPEARRGARGRRWALRSLAVVVLLVVALLGVIGWYYSDEILAVVPEGEPVYDVRVEDVAADTVTLSRTEQSALPGVYGLAGEEWYARVGEVLEDDATTVTRALEPSPDTPVEGEEARIDGYAYPSDPAGVFDFEITEVHIPGELGTYPAHHVDGERDTWAIFVHGRGAHRGEAFRLLPTFVDRGHPALVISYRNDVGAPADPHGQYGLGWTEWRDVDAAVDWAVEQGAQDVVLVGYSMGGVIVGSYLRERDHVEVRGVILDAPAEWDRTLELAARDRGVPTFLTPIAQAVVTLRTGLRWGELSLVEGAEDLDVPILLFHGTDDRTVPVEASDELAALRPGLITYERVEGAGHVRSWNVARDRYTEAVREFLDEVAP